MRSRRFLGDFYFFAGIVCLLFQLLVTSRLLRQFGIGPALFVVPLALLSGSLGVLLCGARCPPRSCFGPATRSCGTPSTSPRSSFCIYRWHPGSSSRSRPSSTPWSGAWATASRASVVLVLVTWGGLSARQVSWANIAVIVAWAVAAARARRQYVETLRESIQLHRLDAERASAPILDRAATELLGDRLQATDPQEILYALGLLDLGVRQATHPAVRGLLEHSAPEVRERAIAILNAAGDTGVSGAVERLLQDPHLEVRTEALLYLSRHKHQDPLTRIEELGDFADFSIRAALVAFLAHPGPSQNLPAARFLFERMVAEPGPEPRRGRMEAARLVGRFPELLSLEVPPGEPAHAQAFGDQALRQLIADPDPEVAVEAVRAAGQLGTPPFRVAPARSPGRRGARRARRRGPRPLRQ